ncbi:hypothetical protein H2200_008103 [Cladophialophora chaetospira]|uniref:Uncharacterized protein n=1 Tax=Cladophialophora chaetospira TaxID=386627 RepID=A0AA39CG93_9EURO|nr:hypothetical protein H2200_008103 [Cladophialophora chaetospira]
MPTSECLVDLNEGTTKLEVDEDLHRRPHEAPVSAEIRPENAQGSRTQQQQAHLSTAQDHQQNTSLPRRRTKTASNTTHRPSTSHIHGEPERSQDDLRHPTLETSVRRMDSDQQGYIPRTANPVEALQFLYARVEDLKREQLKHVQDVQRLESQIKNGEATCGRLLQQYLEISRAIVTKKKHIEEDKAQLSEVQRSREAMDGKIDSILAQISSLVLDHQNMQSLNLRE